MEKIKNFYFVGNAHLDPVWMWRWQEGSCEAKATIRSALDRMKEYPEFKFVCGAAQVFEWIEEFDPQMFEEIRQRVQEGRFVIVNGWFIQADCNLPSGEGFARQALYGQRYFYDKFGVTAKTGYNVDSFGHNAMLPQLLHKSGMDQYIAMRPQPHEKKLPSHVVRWRSPDGTEILYARILRMYHSLGLNLSPSRDAVIYADDPEHMYGYMELVDKQASPDCDSAFMFYGVGNHGGGPTKKNIESILQLKKEHPELGMYMSDTEDFFREIRKNWENIPVVEDDMQHHAAGCYSAVSKIKNDVRRGEWAMFAAENYAMLAKGAMDKPLPDNKLIASAWKNILFAHFHDAMGGCSAEEVYQDLELSLGESRTVAQRLENNALQSLSWRIDTSDPGKGIPVMVFNPHAFPVEVPVLIKKRVNALYDGKGDLVALQTVRASDSRCRQIQGDTVFQAKVPALGWSTYYYHADIPEDGFTSYYFPDKAPAGEGVFPRAEHQGDLTVESDRLRLTIGGHTGHIKSLFDKLRNKELLCGRGAVPVVLDEDNYDTWAHGKTYWTNQVGVFTDAKITVMEEGPVRTRVQVVNRYGNSTLTQNFILYAGSDMLQVEASVDWHERRKLLKLKFDSFCTQEPRAFYEIPYGVFQRPANGEEEPGQSWIAVKQGGEALALINDNKYSFSIDGNVLGMTVVRSPYFIDHGRGDQQDPESVLTDQGVHSFRYALMYQEGDGWAPVTQRARLFNLPPTVIVENNHPGTLADTFAGLSCSADNVIISAFKRSEDGTGIILRVYETDGKHTDVTIAGGALPVPLEAHFGPLQVNTYYLADGAQQWQEVLLTEFPQA